MEAAVVGVEEGQLGRQARHWIGEDVGGVPVGVTFMTNGIN